MQAQIIPIPTTTFDDVEPVSALVVVSPATALATAAAAADAAAAAHVFEDYRSRKAQNTLTAHDQDLERLATFLQHAGVQLAGDLTSEPAAWFGITWGIIEAFNRWQLAEGYAISSIGRALATIKAYAGLAAQAGAISNAQFAMIKAIRGYSHTEGRRVDEKRERTRRGNKKADWTRITKAQADELKKQPNSAQGRRDALLLCLLLDHGLRCGEIADLPANAIDLAEGQFTFYRSKVSTEQTHKLSADTLRAAVAYLMKDGPASGGLLRESIKGGRLTDEAISERAINKRVGELGKRLGIANLSPHDLRHYWTSAARRGKSDLKAMMNAGGWKSPAMPMRYAEDDQIANEGIKLG